MPLMIFAAGFGTRMGDLTKTQPKPMIEVAGKPLIDRALDLATGAGLSKIVVNTHYLADVLETHLVDKQVLISRETPDILETGGGLKNALSLIDASCVTTFNPDAIWAGPNPISVIQSAWQPDKMDALLLCVPLDRAIGRMGGGDFEVDEEGALRRPGDLVYGGVHIIKTHCVAEVDEAAFSLNVVWNRLAAENRVCVEIFEGYWCDVGTPEGITLAEQMIADDV
ncbi:MAG: nucleotidyltransferase family protein [Paracoccaceae bacterium]